MKIYAAHGHLYLDGIPHLIRGDLGKGFPRVVVTDLVSGKEIHRCRFADDQTGDYEHFPHPRGRLPRLFRVSVSGNPVREQGQTKLLLQIWRCTDSTCRACATAFPGVPNGGLAYQTPAKPHTQPQALQTDR